MYRHLLLTRRAQRDLDKIEEYLRREFFSSRAELFLNQILKKCQSIHKVPTQGEPFHSLQSGVRVVGMRRLVSILFRVNKKSVVILSISYRGRLHDAGD